MTSHCIYDGSTMWHRMPHQRAYGNRNVRGQHSASREDAVINRVYITEMATVSKCAMCTHSIWSAGSWLICHLQIVARGEVM